MRGRGRRSTPPGEHRPVLLDEVLAALAPAEGAVVVDCTVGWAGHSAELLQRVGPAGRSASTSTRRTSRAPANGWPPWAFHSAFTTPISPLCQQSWPRKGSRQW